MKIKTILLSALILFINSEISACDLFSTFCLEATNVEGEKIVVGTISNSAQNNIELNIIDVLYGVENNSSITIWDASTFECNGPWPNEANEMGNIGDTILCIVEPINNIINSWDVIGEYRRANLIGGFATYVNFSVGMLFDYTYTYNEVLSLDIANYCCSNLDDFLNPSIYDLPLIAGDAAPISLSAYPEGGTFSGPGIILNGFNPTLAGPGNHTITYTINDEFGCSFSAEQDVLVFTIDFNFVNYNLSTISP